MDRIFIMRMNVLSIMFLFTWSPPVSIARNRKLEKILGIYQDENNFKEAGEVCGCACDHYYEILIQSLEKLKSKLKPRKLPISIVSGGCDDPGLAEDCGTSSIKVDGVEYSVKQRGHNVVVLNDDGSVWTTKSFDTWNFWSGADGEAMNDFLLSIPLGKIVLIAVQDSGDRHVEDAKEGLASVGADTSKLSTDFRSSWLLIGYKGTRQPWQHQDSSPRSKGPTRINTYITLPSEFCRYSVQL